MPKWVSQNLSTIVAIGINLIVMGGAWSAMQGRVTRNDERITKIESVGADETKWRVSALEHRADNMDTLVAKITAKLDEMNQTLIRIDQRTDPKNKP